MKRRPQKASRNLTGMKNKFWTPGSTLRVKFLGGSTALQNQVMQYAEQWEQSARSTS